MRIFSWVTKDTNIDFMKFRKAGYALSIALVVLSVACIVFKGFQLRHRLFGRHSD